MNKGKSNFYLKCRLIIIQLMFLSQILMHPPRAFHNIEQPISRTKIRLKIVTGVISTEIDLEKNKTRPAIV
jgi:hypothetical protein